MNELAVELNGILKDSVSYGFLSEMGKRMYFPKGIVAQSAEAGEKAGKYNSTAGVAKTHGETFCLRDIMACFKDGVFKPNDLFSYAPGGGDKSLRSIWKEEMLRKNPTLKGKKFSDPIVTAGLTHTISLAMELFVNPGDEVVCPDLFWDNYDLITTDLIGAKLKIFRFFTEDGHFNVKAMKEALLGTEGDHARIILNFPNNPTGYTPTKEEAVEIVEAVKSVADTGKKVLVISDDAYFGLFYEDSTEKESLFSYFADAHENIFAVKGDAATKEEMVWGFRIGFITYASKNMTDSEIDALTKKTLGAIRCTVSNCDRPGQSLLLKAFNGDNRAKDKEVLFSEMKERYLAVKNEVSKHTDNPLLKAYPFNSGYFMAFSSEGRDAEELRRYLLDKYGVGIINIMGHTIRVAYCSVEKEQLADLIGILYKAAGEIWN